MKDKDKEEGGRRLFVGVRISMATVDALAGAAESLVRRATAGNVRIRWVAPASYHVTLKYLGWSRNEVIAALDDRLRRAVAGVGPFSFRTARLGAFPSTAKASVVWAGIEDPGARLAGLADAIDREVADLGFPRDRRAFHPHVTLGRLRDLGDVADVLLPLAEQVFSETRVSDVVLFESLTKSTGSEYNQVLSIALERPSEAAKRHTAPLQSGAYDASAGTDDGWEATARPGPPTKP